MPPRKWPYPGDAPVARARLMARAYRATAQEEEELLKECAAILDAVDKRLIAFDNPAVLANINEILKRIRELDGPSVLDKRFHDWGEEWHAEIAVTYEADDLITARQAAPIVGVNHNTIGAIRITGRLKGHWDPDLKGYRYKVSDVWKLCSERRARNLSVGGSTDRVDDNGRSDPE